MADVKPPARRERAAATRRAIVEAASVELAERGFQATTMAAIARRAGVATQTVYFVFHTKAALFTAAVEAAVLDGGPPPEKRPWWVEATTSASGSRALEAFVRGSAEILARAAILVEAGRAAASTDPDIPVVLAHHEGLREAGYRAFTGTLAARGLLRPEVTPAEATEVLLAMVGPNLFLDLTRDRGWDLERYVTWTARALALLLLRPA